MTERDAKEYFEKNDIAIVLIGAVAPHGRHNPLGTDLIHVQEVGRKVSEKTGVLVVDALPFGESEYWLGFPGTVSLRPETMFNVCMDICHSLHETGINKVIFLNGHGGNGRVLTMVIQRITETMNMLGATIDWWRLPAQIDPERFGGGEGHGLKYETSINLAIAPELVNMDEPVKYASLRQPSETESIVFAHPCMALFKGIVIRVGLRTTDFTDVGSFEIGTSPGGTDFEHASADYGKAIIDAAVDYISGFVEEFEKLKLPERN